MAAASYEHLRGIDREVLIGLVRERGDAARSATYEHKWERQWAQWDAIHLALKDAAAGLRPTKAADSLPAWVSSVVRKQVEQLATTGSSIPFEDVRLLERVGLVELEPDDTYVLAVVGGFGYGSTRTPADALRADPELLDKIVWRFFEVEGGGQVSLTNVDKYCRPEMSWGAAIRELTDEGTLPRGAVLESCLSALNRDFSAYRAGWFSRLYVDLEPTLEEQAGHQRALLALLRSDIKATVSFAIKQLHGLSRAGLLEDADAAEALRPAVLAPAKNTAVEALRVLRQILQRRPDLTQSVIATGAAALNHPHADVQREACSLLVELEAFDAIRASVDDLAPSVRAALPERVMQGEFAVAATTGLPQVAGEASRDLVAASREDIVDRLAALLEDASDAVELELVMAGLCLIEGVEAIRPLIKRAATVLQRGPRDDVVPGWLRGQIARLILRAGGEQIPELPTANNSMRFLAHRLDEATEVLMGSRPRHPLLATPDDAAGWVSPHVLMRRLREATNQPLHHDVVAALLRLHPEGREEALAQLVEDDGQELHDVMRYALGGPPSAPRRRLARRPTLRTPAWWIAASRSRTPLDADPWLAERGLTGAGRSDPISARPVFHSKQHKWRDARGEHTGTYWNWNIDVASGSTAAASDEPTAVASQDIKLASWQGYEEFTRWQALIWPHDAEHFLIGSSNAVIIAAVWDVVEHDAVRALDALMRHPGRLGQLALTTIAAGLTAGKLDQRVVAVDTVLHLHASDRLAPAQLATGIVSFIGPGSPTRWATSLQDVARSGPAASRFVSDALTDVLPHFDSATRGLHVLLELLREELLRNDKPTADSLKPWLEKFRGGSRAAKAAVALLA